MHDVAGEGARATQDLRRIMGSPGDHHPITRKNGACWGPRRGRRGLQFIVQIVNAEAVRYGAETDSGFIARN